MFFAALFHAIKYQTMDLNQLFIPQCVCVYAWRRLGARITRLQRGFLVSHPIETEGLPSVQCPHLHSVLKDSWNMFYLSSLLTLNSSDTLAFRVL